VGVGEPAGLERLVNYLCSLGHRRIGYIGHNTVSQQRREKSLRSALADRGLAARKECFMRVRSLEKDTPRAVKTVLSLPPGRRPTALVAGDDVMAQKVMRHLHENGITVPDRMSLAGFDDIPLAGAMIPALTSVRQPLGDMVEAAFRWVTNSDRTPPGRPRTLAPELVVRESCAAPADL
jgi:LacI family transcriptional regulator